VKVKLLDFLKKIVPGANSMEKQLEKNKDVLEKSIAIKEEIAKWLADAQYEKVSLGENCNSAWYLKESGNKKASYPFDWIFSSPAIVEHAVKDDFVSFLDKEFIFQVSENKAGHTLYHSSLFNHKNPLKSDVEYSYYQRSVDRFLKLVKNKDAHILFVFTVIQEYDKRPDWKNGFDRSFKMPIEQDLGYFKNTIRLIKEINSKSKFIFINQFTESTLALDLKDIQKDCLWLDFHSQGRNTGVKYLDDLDDRIMKNIYQGLYQEESKSFTTRF
jgi:hypothetical protein